MWLKLLPSIFGVVRDVVSPELKRGIIQGVSELEKQAGATSNGFDDVLVRILKIVVEGVIGDDRTDQT